MEDDTVREQFKSWLDRFSNGFFHAERLANNRKNKDYGWESARDAQPRLY
jgi:hypothetical protein